MPRSHVSCELTPALAHHHYHDTITDHHELTPTMHGQALDDDDEAVATLRTTIPIRTLSSHLDPHPITT